jgi:hypothetical protein
LAGRTGGRLWTAEIEAREREKREREERERERERERESSGKRGANTVVFSYKQIRKEPSKTDSGFTHAVDRRELLAL